MKFFQQRKGMEIAVSTVVVLIIGIIVFGSGIFLMGKINKGIGDIEKNMDSNTENQLRAQLASGGVVAVPESGKVIRRGQTANYWIAIRNTLNKDQEFTVKTEFRRALTENEEDMFPQLTNDIQNDVQHWIAGQGIDTIEVKNNDARFLDVYIRPGTVLDKSALAGSYFFNVCVLMEGANPDEPCTSNPGRYPPNKMFSLRLDLK